jgi:hypothetical protein
MAITYTNLSHCKPQFGIFGLKIHISSGNPVQPQRPFFNNMIFPIGVNCNPWGDCSPLRSSLGGIVHPIRSSHRGEHSLLFKRTEEVFTPRGNFTPKEQSLPLGPHFAPKLASVQPTIYRYNVSHLA